MLCLPCSLQFPALPTSALKIKLELKSFECGHAFRQ